MDSAIVKIALLLSTFVSLTPIHLAWYPGPGSRSDISPEASVLFGGDMMFDRTIRRAIDVYGGDYLFSCLDRRLQESDLVVANLEGPITDKVSVSATSSPGDEFNYTFTFDPEVASLLRSHHVGLVNLGNNHILNFGHDGVLQTKSYLSRSGVDFFGDVPGDPMVVHKEVRGAKLAFIGYNEFGGNSSSTVAAIKVAREDGEMPIVYTHWGDEYATSAPARIHTLAHSFIDNGAEIVIGSHPHVVEEAELYKGKYIYYSLGNLIFDQYWYDAVRHGLMLDVRFTPFGVSSVREVPVELLRDKRTCLL